MKIINKHVDAIVSHTPEGKMRVWKIRLEENDELQVIKIDKILKTEEIRNGKDKMIKYYCECVINERKRNIELLFDVMKTRWILYRV